LRIWISAARATDPERRCARRDLPAIHATPSAMKKRLYLAMASYAALALLALFTLDGVFRYGIWILMAGLALKSLIAYKAGW
jgi:hypothetical protein